MRMSTPKDQWRTVEALVYSVEWIDPSRNDYGHYKVVYSYKVGEERYVGEFRDYTAGKDGYLHPNDTISIQYNPENPTRSFYPLVHSATKRRLNAAGIGCAVAIVYLLILLLSGAFR